VLYPSYATWLSQVFVSPTPLQTIPVATSLYEYKADEKRALKAGGSVADVASALIYEHTI